MSGFSLGGQPFQAAVQPLVSAATGRTEHDVAVDAEKARSIAYDLAFCLVGDTGIESVTSSVSANGPQAADQRLRERRAQTRSSSPTFTAVLSR
jgi:hypothetical protein